MVFNSDRGYETVAAARQSFDEARVFAGILQGLAQSVHGLVQALVEIYEGICGPQPLHQLIAGDQLAGTLQQEDEDLQWLILKVGNGSVDTEFTCARVECELSETDATPLLLAGEAKSAICLVLVSAPALTANGFSPRVRL